MWSNLAYPYGTWVSFGLRGPWNTYGASVGVSGLEGGSGIPIKVGVAIVSIEESCELDVSSEDLGGRSQDLVRLQSFTL